MTVRQQQQIVFTRIPFDCCAGRHSSVVSPLEARPQLIFNTCLLFEKIIFSLISHLFLQIYGSRDWTHPMVLKFIRFVLNRCEQIGTDQHRSATGEAPMSTWPASDERLSSAKQTSIGVKREFVIILSDNRIRHWLHTGVIGVPLMPIHLIWVWVI